MKKTVEDIRNEMIDAIGEQAEKYGFTRIAGQLEGLLYLSPKPMSLDEMAQRLEVSKASVSTNIRFLERMRIVRRVYHRGARKNYYAILGDIGEIKTEVWSTIVKDEIERCKTLVGRCLSDLKVMKVKGNEEQEELEFVQARFSEIDEYVEAAEHLLDMILKKGKITPAVIKKIKIT
ncbi:GbsR/MarR family transcriptional regulator [Planctomycetota bacterium]